jgi:hypothetical protein
LDLSIARRQYGAFPCKLRPLPSAPSYRECHPVTPPSNQPIPCEVRLTVQRLPGGLELLTSNDMPGLHVAVSGDPALSGGATVFDELPIVINGLRKAYGWPRAKIVVDRLHMVAVLTEDEA